MRCRGVAFAASTEDKTRLSAFLERLKASLEEAGCRTASPAPGSWLLAACSDTLIVVEPHLSVSPLTQPGVGAPPADIVVRVEGPAEGVVDAAQLLIRVARSTGIVLYPIPL